MTPHPFCLQFSTISYQTNPKPHFKHSKSTSSELSAAAQEGDPSVAIASSLKPLAQDTTAAKKKQLKVGCFQEGYQGEAKALVLLVQKSSVCSQPEHRGWHRSQQFMKSMMELQRGQRKAGTSCFHKKLPKSLGLALQFREKA